MIGMCSAIEQAKVRGLVSSTDLLMAEDAQKQAQLLEDRARAMRLAVLDAVTPGQRKRSRGGECTSLRTPLIWVHIIQNTSNTGAHHSKHL